MTIAFKGEADVTGVEEPESLRSLLGFFLALDSPRGNSPIGASPSMKCYAVVVVGCICGLKMRWNAQDLSLITWQQSSPSLDVATCKVVHA